MKVKEINNFQDLSSEWNKTLQSNLFGNNVFLTWEWLSTWWKHFGDGRKPLILIVEDQNKILAIAPLMLSSYKLPLFGNVKKIEFIGVKHSDYSNFIIIDNEKECLKLIINYLKDTILNWNWIELKQIPEPTENSNFLPILFSDISSLTLKTRVCTKCPYIPLPNSFNLLMTGLNKKLRKTLKYNNRNIKEKYSVELKRYDEAGYSVKEAMKVFLNLHEARWAQEGQPGLFKDTSFLNFHMETANIFAEKNWLGLYFLTANDEPVAVQYSFEYFKKMYSYLSGFNPKYAGFSVGNLLNIYLLERCIKNGFVEFDWLRGEEPYKLKWTNISRRNFEIRLIKNGLLNSYYNWITWNKNINNIAIKLKLSVKRTS